MKTIQHLIFALTMCNAALVAAVAAPQRPPDESNARWNLGDIYASPAQFEAATQRIEAMLVQVGACQGHIGESAAIFKKCLDTNADLDKHIYTMQTYGWEYFNQDTTDAIGNQVYQRTLAMSNRAMEASAFLAPEILGLGRQRIDTLVAAEPGLQVYGFYLDKILRSAPHMLDAAGERLVAQFSQANSAAPGIYTTLANAEMPWPTVTLADGSKVKLDQAAYVQYRGSDNRSDRKRVFDTFWGQWKRFEGTVGEILYAQLKSDAALAAVRRYPDSLSAALDGSKLPPAVYQTLLAQAHANLPTLHRYFKLRARLLGLKDLAYYDTYAPLIKKRQTSFTLAQSRQLMLDAVVPLGPDYVRTLTAASAAGWMDAYPRPHKTAGAHVSGNAYDVHPYVLLNYTGNYDSVRTMAHEWGHAMHSVLSNRSQASVNAIYNTFVAEIASTTNEALLLEHMLAIASDDEERLVYLGNALEGLRNSFFRQTMLAEFEAAVHARADRGDTLTGANMSALYLTLLERYNGAAEGAMQIDPAYGIEWSSAPHYYMPFYVFQYATSIAAAQQFAERILADEPGARSRYLALLSAGGTADPYDLVKAAGVDLASPAPYQALAVRMNAIMDQIEAIEHRQAR